MHWKGHSQVQRLAEEPKCLTDTVRGPHPIFHLRRRKGKGDRKQEDKEGDQEWLREQKGRNTNQTAPWLMGSTLFMSFVFLCSCQYYTHNTKVCLPGKCMQICLQHNPFEKKEGEQAYSVTHFAVLVSQKPAFSVTGRSAVKNFYGYRHIWGGGVRLKFVLII